MKKFNERIALGLSSAFSTMGCFWLFAGLALLPLVWPAAMPYVQFISSAFLQLVALPLLAVAGKVMRERQEEHGAALAAHGKALEGHGEVLAGLHAKTDKVLAASPQGQ